MRNQIVYTVVDGTLYECMALREVKAEGKVLCSVPGHGKMSIAKDKIMESMPDYISDMDEDMIAKGPLRPTRNVCGKWEFMGKEGAAIEEDEDYDPEAILVLDDSASIILITKEEIWLCVE